MHACIRGGRTVRTLVPHNPKRMLSGVPGRSIPSVAEMCGRKERECRNPKPFQPTTHHPASSAGAKPNAQPWRRGWSRHVMRLSTWKTQFAPLPPPSPKPLVFEGVRVAILLPHWVGRTQRRLRSAMQSKRSPPLFFFFVFIQYHDWCLLPR
ncbi:hypothetical protein BC567DRAFT_96711 [Phyllosticta citribraziliensis]